MNYPMIEDAIHELRVKTSAQIEKETAYKWAARAAAAYSFYIDNGDARWRLDASKYHDEACEHASLADATGECLREVRKWMSAYIPVGGV